MSFENFTKKISRSLLDVKDAPFVKEVCKACSNMYRMGWDERNGGNISYLLEEKDVEKYLDTESCIREIPMGFKTKMLVGKYFLVTGTGKYFKNVEEDPANNLGIIKIAEDGETAKLLWGYEDGGKFTSELPAHLMSHTSRLIADPQNRVVMHSHPTNILAMTFVHDLNEREFTRTLWRMVTECMVVFPDGVGVLPWMLCGNNEIGKATAEKMEEFRLVVWANHGIYGAGKTMDEAFGLIETVEKAAELYLKIAHLPRVNTITDEQLKIIADGFNLKAKEGWLDL
ncbi:MAG: rhamnulose-1-phosphate aldolase [Bacillota bacterium]|nr:MAG: rhamnulose-1-phosphate aldolase [Bacillota bacterium]